MTKLVLLVQLVQADTVIIESATITNLAAMVPLLVVGAARGGDVPLAGAPPLQEL